MIARKHLGTTTVAMPYEDLVQEGFIGLIEAQKRFDPTLGNKFSTYAVHWVRHYIQRAVHNKALTVRIPVHKQIDLQKKKKRLPVSVSSYYRPWGDGGCLLDILQDEGDLPDAWLDQEAIKHEVHMAMAELPERHRQILWARFSKDGRTLKDIGDEHGVSRERIRQIVKEAIAMMRRRLQG